MKRLIAAGILTVVVISVYLTGFFVIDNACDGAKTILNKCINAYKNEENADEIAENLKSYWGKKEKILSVFANHSEIDDIEMAIDILCIYSKTKEKEIFSEYSGTVKTLLHQMKEDTIPNIHSIF